MEIRAFDVDGEALWFSILWGSKLDFCFEVGWIEREVEGEAVGTIW